MPYAAVNGTKLYYRIDGAADSNAPWLVLSNSLGTDVSMWAPQVPEFAKHFRVLRYDTRGHGRSDAPKGPYTIGQLTGDVIGLLDQLGIARAHFVGLSMGGLTGVGLGARYAARIDRLVLCNTAAKIGSPQVWEPRAERARNEGMAGLADAVPQRWFTPAFIEREPLVIAQLRDNLAHTDNEGYASNCDAINAADLRGEASSIKAPTLVISSTHDLAATPAQGRELAESIDGARYVELGVSHISNIEAAETFTGIVRDFLLESK
ncbi:3-oxoadipate enol-lactonase [Paraburkholderia caballeronis]|uniref:3-oxoadipate enol-lactonase n=1 Tax=Paraburkholderia caballeronis TaxID=416943 RepID=A0A1H7P3R5_9BURK|nr:3-oxoadipate enol-lactonase [Paraburkholderia caballeronis]PXW25423.1 3-oxoadipate enol-lactonase [Paraburkholderia caballeronis]PXX01030.1 3-oxoadipate enol-lactonase [Paraburkholderia caballeronis]RAJ99617.1 3-oxoadipate enol-lactonase [Paraburkholderia caballeronis]TDV11404.1 3-oxoadipate enol-lactonase [Paraburkholderia caballeronis]TDV14594.1 3-oxoadipate enol-lactonase [Paraburkholderia caballeronis]